jgi:hypothetical protein
MRWNGKLRKSVRSFIMKASLELQHSDVRTANSAEGTLPRRMETIRPCTVVVRKPLGNEYEADTG